VPVEIHERDVLRGRERDAMLARAARPHEQVPVVDAQADVAEGGLHQPLDREHPARERDEPPLGRIGNGHDVVSSCSPRAPRNTAPMSPRAAMSAAAPCSSTAPATRTYTQSEIAIACTARCSTRTTATPAAASAGTS